MLILTWKITLMKIGSIKTVLWSKASKVIASPYFILLAATILCYFDVATFQHPLKWDIIDPDLPLRYFVSDCIQNGIFPYWNPYQGCGYPNYAIPITWYPTVWIFSLMGHYGIVALTIDFLLHIYIAGIGMFLLARRFGYSDATGCILGICYLACGFFVGNAQHFGWVIGAAWIPYLFAYFIDLSRNNDNISFIKLLLICYLLATGAYPALIFLSIWIVLFITIYYCVERYKTNGIKSVWQYLTKLIFLAICAMAISVIAIVPTIQLWQLGWREMDLDYLMKYRQPLGGMISLLLPYATAAKDNLWDELVNFYGPDANTMMNVYFGLLAFIFFAISIFRKKNVLHRIFLYTGVAYLLACFPHKFPVRELMIKYIPTMDLFRIVSVYRVFFILGAIICAGIVVEDILNGKCKIKHLTAILSSLFIIGIIASIYANKQNGLVWQHISRQSLIQSCILALAMLMLIQKRVPAKLWLTLLVLTDMGIATQANASCSIYYKYYSFSKILKNEQSFPKDYYPVGNNKPIIETDGHGFAHYWRNSNTFMKDFSYNNYSPYFLRTFDKLESNQLLFRKTLDNNVAFLSTNIAPLSEINDTSKYSNNIVFVDLDDYCQYKNDSGKCELILQKTEPNIFTMSTDADYPQMLTLLQSNFHGWKAYVDNTEVQIHTANECFMSIEVPSGKHNVHFVFKNYLIVALALISVIGFLSCCVLIVILYKKQGKSLAPNIQ